MERLSLEDDALLRIEDDVSSVHGMTVGVFSGPQPAFDDLLDLVASRIPFVPRYRQRLAETPLGFHRPVWVDDPYFSLDFHVRNTALPLRRDVDALSALVGRLQSQHMDRCKPLWELWVVSDLSDGHWALISKVHYAMVDGVSGVDIFGLLLDETPTTPHEDLFSPAPLPAPHQLIPAAITDIAFNPVESLRAAASLMALPYRAVVRSVHAMSPSTETTFRADIGPHRRWHRCRLSLELFRGAREQHRCTTTDVILASIAGGIRHYLLERGEQIPPSLTTLVPFAVASEETSYNHEVHATKAQLPIGLDDPVARLDTIAAQTALTAHSRGAVAGRALRRQDQFSAPTVMALGLRSALQVAHASAEIDTLTVNMPGPDEHQHVLERELLKVYPVIPLAGRVRMAVAALSYENDISFGITGDYDASPDLWLVADGIRATVNDLA